MPWKRGEVRSAVGHVASGRWTGLETP